MKRILIVFLSLSLIVSCHDIYNATSINSTEVDVCLEFAVSAPSYVLISESSETKTVMDIDLEDDSMLDDVVKNYWVLQFNGTDDEALLTGEPRYYESVENQIKLVASDGKENSVVLIANTFEPEMIFPQGEYRLKDLKRWLREVEDDENFLSAYGENKYIVFGGIAQSYIYSGAQLSFTLERNIAKAAITIVNSSTDVSITSWQLRSVPSVSYYLTNYQLLDIWPSVGQFVGVDYPEVKPSQPLVMGGEVDYLAYLPVNKWGICEEVTNENYKNRYAPDGATYLQVNAVCDGEPLVYKFYLGENMTTDFNVLPNSSYVYRFEIKSKGDAEFDSRIEEPCIIDFANTNDELANCYIINPAEINGVLRRFRIPVKRVDEFWGGVSGYEDESENTLGYNGSWQVEILATNFDNSTDALAFTKATGIGSYHETSAELQYFEFTVRPGTEGSAIVGLRKNGGPILWSWHLWITDYSPEEAYLKTPQSGVYSYPVTGGNVHRYEGSIWTGEYAGRFIMDRNIGALDAGYPKSSNEVLYYQFGRKDPFFGFSNFSIVKFDNIHSDTDPAQTLKYSIMNPLAYISTNGRSTWTVNNKYNPDSYDEMMHWFDPYTSKKKYPGTIMDKSIFDPCPPGYVVPKSGVWSDFSSSSTTNLDGEVLNKRGFQLFSEAKGVCYWPNTGDGISDLPNEVVYYPALGYMENFSISQKDNLVYQMSISAIDKTQFAGLKAGMENDMPSISTGYTLHHNLALPVRCITSRDAE